MNDLDAWLQATGDGNALLRIIVDTRIPHIELVLPQVDESHRPAADAYISRTNAPLDAIVGGMVNLDAQRIATCAAIGWSSYESHYHITHQIKTLDTARDALLNYLRRENIPQASGFIVKYIASRP